MDVKPNMDQYPAYVPNDQEREAQNTVLKDYTDLNSVMQKSYAQFNGRTLYESIDDWEKRWNGYIPGSDPLVDSNSRVFLNFTRNAYVSFLSKVAMNPLGAKFQAIHKKTGLPDRAFSDMLADLKKYSDNADHADSKFMDTCLEAGVKGTAIVYEGYMRDVQKRKVPDGFDVMDGRKIGKFREVEQVIYDDCYQKIVPLEDFWIKNPYEPDVQKQPKVIWKTITTHSEASAEFGKYANWKYVKPGGYSLSYDPNTFYRNSIITDLGKDQVEVVREYIRRENRHIVMVSSVILYDGPFPFANGLYPFSKSIFEPFSTTFFWGSSFPQKVMGEQDQLNTQYNMMNEKTYNSLLPIGLSSDLDDLVEDDVIESGKWRKVGDVNNWKWLLNPGVDAGENQMLQTTLNFLKENSGSLGGNANYSPKGGKLPARQIQLMQQEMMQKLEFSMSYLEDGERDRSKLRIDHILQWYSIPKIEKVTGKTGDELSKLIYRDVRLTDTDLGGGRKGSKVIKLFGSEKLSSDEQRQIEDDLSVIEAMGQQSGQETQALALNVDTFSDYNISVQIIKNSSFSKNQALDQASRMEYAQWRLSILQLSPLKVNDLVRWVDESYDVDSDRWEFSDEELAQQQAQQAQAPQPGGGAPGSPQQPSAPSSPNQPQPGPAAKLAPSVQKQASPASQLAQVSS